MWLIFRSPFRSRTAGNVHGAETKCTLPCVGAKRALYKGNPGILNSARMGAQRGCGEHRAYGSLRVAGQLRDPAEAESGYFGVPDYSGMRQD